jgi:hypothetical protein
MTLFTLLTGSYPARLACPVWTLSLAGDKLRPGFLGLGGAESALFVLGDVWRLGSRYLLTCCLVVAPF